MKAIPGSTALDPVFHKDLNRTVSSMGKDLGIRSDRGWVCLHMLATVMLVQNNANPRKYRRRRCA